MPYEIHPEAEPELEQAALWYEQMQASLGEAFLAEFERGLAEMQSAPESPLLGVGKNRYLNFKFFPYSIVYDRQGGTFFITAVMHLHRRPFYWSRRSSKV